MYFIIPNVRNVGYTNVMNVGLINEALRIGNLDEEGVFPHLDTLKNARFIFRTHFGLEKLPVEPGFIAVRGPRQYGKSTWLESKLKQTVEEFGAGSGFYLNGDEIIDFTELMEKIRVLAGMFHPAASVRRIFIDEITAVHDWERAIKRLVDAGELRRVLLITTGSKASDLRRGIERMPGRKGKLDRNSYLFLPVSYSEFKNVCGPYLKAKTLLTYLLSGGCPIACRELAESGTLPEYVITLIREWILGEITASGRHREILLKIFEMLFRFGGTPVGYSKLARECAVANNTVAAGYIELLGDLLCVVPGFSWDYSRKITVHREPCKFQIINLLAMIAWHSTRVRSIHDFNALESKDQGKFWEWLVAQELWRQQALISNEPPSSLNFWKSKSHELDFVEDQNNFIEVKKGPTTPFEFNWFIRDFPKSAKLTVISQSKYETDRIRGITFEQFLGD